jgi:MFS family permease
MYPSVRATPLLSPQRADDDSVDGLPDDGVADDANARSVPANVVYLGLTSLFTDVSSEMVTAILPIYLVTQLRFTPAEVGLFLGLQLGVAGMASIAGGVFADRRRRYKEVAGAGYAVSAACKLGLLAARNSPWPATGALAVDRIGKGIRSSPRDALISLSARPSRLGTAFGVHRAFDTAGAVAGPIVAFAVLRAAPDAYDAVFVVSFLVALIGLGVLVLFVQNRRGGGAEHRIVSWRSAGALLARNDFRRLVGAGTLLGVFTIADAFVYLIVREHMSFETEYFPLLFVGTAVSYLVLAIPLGHLADRVGRSRVFLAGYALLALVYVLLLDSSLGVIELVLLLGLLGAFYACTDGVLAAMASIAVPRGQRTSGLAILTTAAAFSGFVASLAFGAMWSRWGPSTTVGIFLACLVGALGISARFLGIRAKRYG